MIRPPACLTALSDDTPPCPTVSEDTPPCLYTQVTAAGSHDQDTGDPHSEGGDEEKSALTVRYTTTPYSCIGTMVWRILQGGV